MSKRIKICFALSLALNFSALLLFVTAVFSNRRGALFYWNPVPSYTTAALLVSLPMEEENALAFGPADITLREGGSAFLQYVFVKDGRQAAWNITYVYDAKIIALEYHEGGVIIKALSSGSSTMQTLDRGGVRDACYVTVVER